MNQEVKYVVQDNGPGLGTWLFCGLGASLLVAGVYHLNIVLDTARTAELQARLIERLEKVRTAEQLTDTNEFRPLLFTQDGKPHNALTEIYSVGELVDAGRFDKALYRVRASRFPNISQKDQLEESIILTADSSDSTEESKENAEKLEIVEEGLQKQLDIISNDLLRVFNQETVSFEQEPNWSKEQLQLYPGGPLEGLPVLAGVPTRVVNKDDLAPYLEGTYVSATEKYLASLRNRVLRLQSEAQRYRFTASDSMAELESKKNHLVEARKDTRKILHEAIFELAKPAMEEDKIWLYTEASKALAPTGIKLPELHVRKRRVS